MIKKTNSLMTWSGIIGAFGVGLVAVPFLVMQAYAQVVKDGPPPWFNHLILPLMLVGFILAAAGHALSGIVGKGQDEVPTIPQVEAATVKAVADKVVTLTEARPSEMPAVPVTIVPPSKE